MGKLIQNLHKRVSSFLDSRVLLLVLDLNGSLVLRSRNNKSVWARPYLESLLSYLSHPSVIRPRAREPYSAAPNQMATAYRESMVPEQNDLAGDNYAFIDTMVWSSAQPDSVKFMIERTFRDHARHLIAVWDRTFFGLNRKEYHNKTLTVKDLRRPWIFLPEPYVHSSRTTLLLDDSVDKAQLQPHNHICLTDYTTARRQLDVQTRLRLLRNPGDPADPSYDSMLLAIVGVIEAARKQSNVAHWLATGGLRKVDVPHDSGMHHNVEETRKLISNESTGLWFDDPDVLQYWINQGQQTLRRLDIPLIPGVVV